LILASSKAIWLNVLQCQLLLLFFALLDPTLLTARPGEAIQFVSLQFATEPNKSIYLIVYNYNLDFRGISKHFELSFAVSKSQQSKPPSNLNMATIRGKLEFI
jgi:hypothetical protein